MKRMVFWKILFGFWITTILISQGIWLMFNVLRPEQQNDMPRGMSIAMIAAESIITHEGGPAFQKRFAEWPGYFRERIIVTPNPPSGPAITDPQGRRYRVTARPAPSRRERGPLDTPWEVLVASFLGGLGFSAVIAWYFTAPVARIRDGFDRLAKGDFAIRLEPAIGRRRDEIADLARDFDIMAKRLEELVKARDRLLAGVSHELRSPLARMQLAIALARQEPARIEASLERVAREATRLDEMVGELLTLSKLESGVRAAEDYFDLAEVARLVTEDAKFEAGPSGINVELQVDPPNADWVVLGNGRLISHAVENIVRNALRFSARGQTVRLVLDRDGVFFRLRVTDQGRGVSEELLGTLFKPFVQGTGDGQGFGLGLAIAERAVTAHGGSIAAVNESAGGFTITMKLPPADLSGQS